MGKSANNRIAVIDIGSNTIHLVIYDLSLLGSKPFKIIYRNRAFIYLAGGGLGKISKAAFERGINCLKDFKGFCENLNVDAILCKATAALRSAINASEFINLAAQQIGLNIEIISGQEEAHFVNVALNQSTKDLNFPLLYLDIGGGSVEFIINHGQKIEYSSSVNIGISEIRSQWKREDPPNEHDIDKLKIWLEDKLSGILENLKTYKPRYLVGASGPFEIINSLEQKSLEEELLISKDQFFSLHKHFKDIGLEQRLLVPGMPANRADLAIESFELIRYLLNRLKSIDHIYCSPYTMKEGILLEHLEESKNNIRFT